MIVSHMREIETVAIKQNMKDDVENENKRWKLNFISFVKKIRIYENKKKF